jgi:hypothetical protein
MCPLDQRTRDAPSLHPDPPVVGRLGHTDDRLKAELQGGAQTVASRAITNSLERSACLACAS